MDQAQTSLPQAYFWIEVISASILPITLIGLFVNRAHSKRGLGVRIIQFVGICAVPPIILILGLEKVLDGSTIGTLLGGILGYLFSSIGKFDEREDKAGKATIPTASSVPPVVPGGP